MSAIRCAGQGMRSPPAGEKIRTALREVSRRTFRSYSRSSTFAVLEMLPAPPAEAGRTIRRSASL